MDAPGQLRIGTSAFTATGWSGTFYPAGLPSRDYLSYYATKFDTVEVDATFYAIPKPTTVRAWYDKTPHGFVFALKVPQVITHEKVLRDCHAELKEFLATADLLSEKLGPLLFQFGYFGDSAFRGLDEFLAQLLPFLDKLPKGYRFAIEIRNKRWLVPRFTDALRRRGIALALIDRSWMFLGPSNWFEKIDPVTTDFSYIRLLGDRKAIEEQTRVWDKIVVDRTEQLRSWVDACRRIVRRGVLTYLYANNHYQGFGPGTVEQFRKFWTEAGMPPSTAEPKRPAPAQTRLFD